LVAISASEEAIFLGLEANKLIPLFFKKMNNRNKITNPIIIKK
jgi:hypothetical protein